MAADHLFFTFIALISISAVLGLEVFYKWGVVPQKAESGPAAEIVKFKENIYQNILKEWQSREDHFEAAKTREYPDLFR